MNLLEEKEDTQQSYKDIAYAYIKKQIISGILKPGSIIDEKKYISELRISRTPVREALSRLSEEGLVTIMSRRGITVSHILIKDVLDIYDVRKVLEPHIIDLIEGKTDKIRLEQFRNDFNNTPMMSSTATGRDLDSEFHMYLVGCTANKILISTEEILMSQSQRIRVLSSASDTERDTEARSEHIDMIRCLLSDNFSGAKEICLQHLEKSIDRYRKIFSNSSFFSIQ